MRRKFAVLTLSLFFLFCIRIYVVSIVRVGGISMWPNYKDGDFVLLIRPPVAHWLGYIDEPGQAIVLASPASGAPQIKRIAQVGEGEIYLKNGQSSVARDFQLSTTKVKDEVAVFTEVSPRGLNYLVLIDKYRFDCGNSEVYSVPRDSVFILGDNRCYSTDSRSFGPIRRKNILGYVGPTLLSFKTGSGPRSGPNWL